MSKRARDGAVVECAEVECEEEGRPPLFKTWRRVYIAVLVNLFLLVAIFYLATEMFS